MLLRSERVRGRGQIERRLLSCGLLLLLLLLLLLRLLVRL
jgi:hypothetical protein